MTTPVKMAKRAAAGTLALTVCLTGGIAAAGTASAAKPTTPPGQALAAVVVVSGENANLVDATTAAPLAAVLGAPVILAPRGGLSDADLDLLADLDPDRVVVVGGTSAVSDATARAAGRASVQESGRGQVTRLAGDDRYATGRAVAKAVAAL